MTDASSSTALLAVASASPEERGWRSRTTRCREASKLVWGFSWGWAEGTNWNNPDEHRQRTEKLILDSFETQYAPLTAFRHLLPEQHRGRIGYRPRREVRATSLTAPQRQVTQRSIRTCGYPAACTSVRSRSNCEVLTGIDPPTQHHVRGHRRHPELLLRTRCSVTPEVA